MGVDVPRRGGGRGPRGSSPAGVAQGPEPAEAIASWRDGPGSRTTGTTARELARRPYKAGAAGGGEGGRGSLGGRAEVGTSGGFIHLHLVKGTPVGSGEQRGRPGNCGERLLALSSRALSRTGSVSRWGGLWNGVQVCAYWSCGTGEVWFLIGVRE